MQKLKLHAIGCTYDSHLADEIRHHLLVWRGEHSQRAAKAFERPSLQLFKRRCQVGTQRCHVKADVC